MKRSWRAWTVTSCVLMALLVPAARAQSDPVPLLIDKLQNSDSFRVRTQAAAVLGRLRDERATQPLIEALGADDSYAVRGASASALGFIGGKKVVGPLFQALGDADSLVQSLSEKALGEVQGEGVVAAFRLHLIEGREREQTLAFIRIKQLAARGDDEAIQVLIEVLPDPRRRAEVEKVLAAIPAERARSALLPALQSEDAEVRASAARLLAGFPAEDVVDALADAYDRAGEEESVRHELRTSITSMKNLLDLDDLVDEARQGETRADRARAIRLLGVTGGLLGSATLEELLDDPDPFVQGAAALALADAGASKAVPKIVRLRSRTDNERLRNILDAVLKILRK